MGLVVRSILRWSKASGHSELQWKTASFRVKACNGPVMAAKFLTSIYSIYLGRFPQFGG